MAWEWVAPVASAAVGITGIAATFLTGRQGREAQKASQEQQFREHRLRELTNARRVLYARFLGEVRQFSLLSGAQSVIDDSWQVVVDTSLLPDKLSPTQAAAFRREFEESVQEKIGLYDTREWTHRVATITALREEVLLMCGPEVAEAAAKVMECLPWTLQPGSLEHDKKELREQLPRRIACLGRVMAAEVLPD